MIDNLKHFARIAKSKYDQFSFEPYEPYIEPINVKGVDARFYFGTGQAKKWYGHLNPFSKLEYEWILSTIDFHNQKIIDGGSHHGHYSVIFAAGSENTCNLISVDPFPMNCLLTEINLRLNNYEPHIEKCAISTQNGQVRFENISNGRILKDGGIVVPAKRLVSIMPDAEIIKLDIEGAEFDVIPDSIGDLVNVRTWIVEVHPSKYHLPDELVDQFKENNYQLLWVNRDRVCVEKYKLGTQWNFHHTTIFAVR